MLLCVGVLVGRRSHQEDETHRITHLLHLTTSASGLHHYYILHAFYFIYEPSVQRPLPIPLSTAHVFAVLNMFTNGGAD